MRDARKALRRRHISGYVEDAATPRAACRAGDICDELRIHPTSRRSLGAEAKAVHQRAATLRSGHLDGRAVHEQPTACPDEREGREAAGIVLDEFANIVALVVDMR